MVLFLCCVSRNQPSDIPPSGEEAIHPHKFQKISSLQRVT